MPPNVKARAFDPFYTTKPIGKGTGLGLSMIYGFMRQSDGSVTIDSEFGKVDDGRNLLAAGDGH
jgi:signal transduction histidine kinase